MWSPPHENMVEVVKISKKGKLLWIKEVPDIYEVNSHKWIDGE
jgi:hypothetical protein